MGNPWMNFAERYFARRDEEDNARALKMRDEMGPALEAVKAFNSEELLDYYDRMPRPHSIMTTDLYKVHEEFNQKVRDILVERLSK